MFATSRALVWREGPEAAGDEVPATYVVDARASFCLGGHPEVHLGCYLSAHPRPNCCQVDVAGDVEKVIRELATPERMRLVITEGALPLCEEDVQRV